MMMMTMMMMTTAMTTESDAALLEVIAESLERTLITHERVSSQVSGDGIVVSHRVEFEGSDGSREHHLLYVESSQRTADNDGVLTLRDEESGDQVAVWFYPNDPALPALPAAVFPDGAAIILQRLGVSGVADVTLTLAAYRPGRRAVIRVDTDRATVFLKVVAPGAAADLAQVHTSWLEAGLPVPHVVGWSDEGLLALSALGGVPASEAVHRVDPESFTAELSRVQARIAEVPSTAHARRSLSSRLEWYERRLTELAPAQAARVHEVSRRIESVLAAAAAPLPVTVHGDLHVGQLFLHPETDAITGVLDIDTAGLGDPADDAAALYAHLLVTSVMNSASHPAVSASCERLASRWQERWRHNEDPDLSDRATAIAATHLLAHALNESLDTAALVGRAETLLANIREL